MLAGGPPRALVGCPGKGTPEPRDGLRGRTTGADGASRSRYRADGRGRNAEEESPRTPSAQWPSLASEANPQAGGTARPNTSARLAGRGPPMAGHVCQSVCAYCLFHTPPRGKCDKECFKLKRKGKPQFGPGNTWLGAPDRPHRGSDTILRSVGGVCLEVQVSENWVSDFVRRVSWRSVRTWRGDRFPRDPPGGAVTSHG